MFLPADGAVHGIVGPVSLTLFAGRKTRGNRERNITRYAKFSVTFRLRVKVFVT